MEDRGFDLESIDLPLFSRPLANLWSRVVVVQYEDVSLRLFDLIHADMLGEGSMSRTISTQPRIVGSGNGMSVVSCALALVDADMPLIVIRPRYEPFSLPARLRQRETELGEFNRRFRLFSEDAYAATAIVDQRTIEAVRGFDAGTAIEIGGPAILLYTSRLDSPLRLMQQTASLARTFPSVAASLFPATPGRLVSEARWTRLTDLGWQAPMPQGRSQGF
jgi:hypothetical protein